MGKRKKPTESANSESNQVESNTDVSTDINSTTETSENQYNAEQDDIKGRHFTYVVYPESAPTDWIEQLKYTGLAFVVSPVHDKDLNPDNTPKKTHYHVIVSWGNTTTYKTARELCKILNCPIPQVLRSCTGMYRYFNHVDNPEKYQYTDPPKAYNGWVKPLDKTDISKLKMELWKIIYLKDCREYGQLLSESLKKGSEYFEVASSNTLFFKSVCDGYRHSKVEVLKRFYDVLENAEEKEIIKSRLDELLNLDIKMLEIEILQRFYESLEDTEDKKIIKNRLNQFLNIDIETGEIISNEKNNLKKEN